MASWRLGGQSDRRIKDEGGQTLSFTRSGAPISAERSPRKVFQTLFVQGKLDEIDAAVEALRQGRSMLDFVGEQAKRLNGVLPAADRQRLDQYATSVRDRNGGECLAG